MRLGARQPGFTLLELVLVLVILSTALGVAAPSLRGWSRGSRLRDAADQFTAITRLARSQAVSTSRLYRLHVGTAGEYRLTVQQGLDFVPAESLGGIFTVPEGFRLEMIKAVPTGGSWIDFHPSGRTEPARIRITSDLGEPVEIVCASPAEPFEVVWPGGLP